MANEQFSIYKGLSSDIPTTKTPGRIWFATDTGEMFVDVNSSTRKQVKGASEETIKQIGTITSTSQLNNYTDSTKIYLFSIKSESTLITELNLESESTKDFSCCRLTTKDNRQFLEILDRPKKSFFRIYKGQLSNVWIPTDSQYGAWTPILKHQSYNVSDGNGNVVSGSGLYYREHSGLTMCCFDITIPSNLSAINSGDNLYLTGLPFVTTDIDPSMVEITTYNGTFIGTNNEAYQPLYINAYGNNIQLYYTNNTQLNTSKINNKSLNIKGSFWYF